MTANRTLTALEIREIGEILFGFTWQGEMAQAVGVPRQSISYYLKAGGVKGTQAAAIVGLVARTAARELRTAKEQQAIVDVRQVDLSKLLHRFDNR
ncbi:MAG: hypothetical protein ACHP7P_16940 [Terriglobales bacterium]